jgi:hypothetical protein
MAKSPCINSTAPKITVRVLNKGVACREYFLHSQLKFYFKLKFLKKILIFLLKLYSPSAYSGYISLPIYADDGTYLKSICRTYSTYTSPDEIRIHCESYGMIPFAITRREEFDIIREFYVAQLGTSSKAYVSGYKENGTWYVNNPEKAPLFAAAIPADQTKGDCLAINGTATIPMTDSIVCKGSSYYGFCQWDLQSKYLTCPS